MKKELRPFGLRDQIGYAFGDFGGHFTFGFVSNYILLFYTQYIGIPTALYGFFILLLKLWDGINDPLVGALIDRKATGGQSKYKPWIKKASWGVVFGGILIFLPVSNSVPLAVRFGLLIVSYFIWDMCYTCVNVPYGAMNSSISADSDDRTALSTWRNIGAIAAGAFTMLVPIIAYDDNDTLLGGRFVWIAAGIGVIQMISYTLLLRLTTERVSVPQKVNNVKYIHVLKGCITNRPLVGISIATIACLVFFMSTMTTNSLVFQCYFRSAKLLPFANIASYVPMAMGVLVIRPLAKRFGKRLAAGVPVLISIVACVVMLLLPMGPDDMVIWVICLMFVNVGGGAFTLIIWAIITDCIDYQQWKTRHRDEASVYAFYSMVRKISHGVGASLIAFILSAIGYDETLGANQLPATALAIKDTAIILVLVGAVIMAVAILGIYNLTKEKMRQVTEDLGKAQNAFDIGEALVNRND
ncbi:MAG: glycoside-pentoside-hexuronide (GPH):cation symporter [Oscillospiraceae bacterium]|nr:glycoside-pentoside-hexuronide (GPH):cation symporter [Oscillospiraceae bacterium]